MPAGVPAGAREDEDGETSSEASSECEDVGSLECGSPVAPTTLLEVDSYLSTADPPVRTVTTRWKRGVLNRQEGGEPKRKRIRSKRSGQ